MIVVLFQFITRKISTWYNKR